MMKVGGGVTHVGKELRVVCMMEVTGASGGGGGGLDSMWGRR